MVRGLRIPFHICKYLHEDFHQRGSLSDCVRFLYLHEILSLVRIYPLAFYVISVKSSKKSLLAHGHV